MAFTALLKWESLKDNKKNVLSLDIKKGRLQIKVLGIISSFKTYGPKYVSGKPTIST